jgi:hypothetical protein
VPLVEGASQTDFSANLQSGVAPRHQPNELSMALAAHGVDLASLSFECWSPITATRSPARFLDSAYKCWSALQEDLHRELGAHWEGTSDEFSRQDEWGCLVYAGECIALVGFRWVDMTFAFSEDDSYFRGWPATARKRLAELGPEICIASNLSVIPSWRGRMGEFSVKELLVRLCVERSNHSAAGAMAATLRNSKGMNLVLYGVGAEPIVTNLMHPHFNAAIDLVAVPKRDAPEGVTQDLMGSLARLLWLNFDEKENDNAALAG